MKILHALLLPILFFAMVHCIGCAQDRMEMQAAWEKNVVIVFNEETTDSYIDWFLDSERLEFMKKLRYNVVEARIVTGESVVDFQSRLESHPDIEAIYTPQQYYQMSEVQQ